MLEVQSTPVQTAAMLVARARAASALFPYDHNLRRLPAAMAAGLAPVMQLEEVRRELLWELSNDPHARDVKAQLAEVEGYMK